MIDLLAGRPIEHVLALLWMLGLAVLGLGIFLASLVLAGRKFRRFKRLAVLSVLSIVLNVGAIGTLVWVGSLHKIQFTYQPQMTGAEESFLPGGIHTSTWKHAIPPMRVFRMDWVHSDSIALNFGGILLNYLSTYPKWKWFFDRVLPRLSLEPRYQVSHRLRLQVDNQSKGDEGAGVSAWFLQMFGSTYSETVDLATVTLTSSLEAQGRVHIWPLGEFRIDCLSDNGPVPVRPQSHWISDENLKEHETFTLPKLCAQGDSITVDIYLSRGERFDEIARFFMRTVQVNEPDLDYKPRLSAYIGVSSFRPGDELPIKINAGGPVDIEIIRLGLESQIVHAALDVPVQPQKTSMLSFREGVSWDVAYQFTVPRSWQSGYYVAKITRETENFYAYFLLSNEKNDSQPPIAIMVPTNTWQAYNPWGGGGFYSLDLGEIVKERQAHEVSMHRPMLLGAPATRNEGSHLVQAELEIVKWLEASGYAYTVYTDSDIDARPGLLLGYRLVVIPSHSEYWTDKMRQALSDYLESGGNLAYLGGNAMYQRVTIQGDVMEGYNHRQFHQNDGKLGGYYYLLNQPQSSILGVQYDSVGYSTFAPYCVRANDHWALAGTGLKIGDEFGSGTHGEKRYFASGHEMDKATKWSPKNLIILAEGLNNEGGAMMTIYDHPGGGFVYAVGSISYANTLNLDKVQGKILTNVIERALLSIDPKLSVTGLHLK